jgi:hypothetical protein
VWVSHVGADDADNLSPIGIIPHDASDADVCTEFDKSLPSEPVQIEPKPVLQTNSGSSAGHCCVSPFAIAWSETHVSLMQIDSYELLKRITRRNTI